MIHVIERLFRVTVCRIMGHRGLTVAVMALMGTENNTAAAEADAAAAAADDDDDDDNYESIEIMLLRVLK